MLAIASVLGALAFPGVAQAVDSAAVERAATEEGLGPFAAALGAAARDGVVVRRRVVAGPPVELGTTRLGGPADLPPHVRWPRCRGRAMTFLGQVRVEELPLAAGAPGPMLSFFAQVRAGAVEWLWAGDCGAIVVVAPGAPLVRRDAPRGPDRLVLRSASVSFVPEASLPMLDVRGRLGAPLDQLALDDAQRLGYESLRARLRDDARPAHRMLGYPDGADEDPRDFCAARHGGVPADWQLVLQLDADRRLGFFVAGGGRLFLLARASDLAVARVGRVCSAFDAR